MFRLLFIFFEAEKVREQRETIILCEELDEMKNVKMVVNKNNILTIRVDLNKNYGDSKSGKSIVIASTEGNVSLDDELPNIKIGLNVYKQLYSGRDWDPVD